MQGKLEILEGNFDWVTGKQPISFQQCTLPVLRKHNTRNEKLCKLGEQNLVLGTIISKDIWLTQAILEKRDSGLNNC